MLNLKEARMLSEQKKKIYFILLPFLSVFLLVVFWVVFNREKKPAPPKTNETVTEKKTARESEEVGSAAYVRIMEEARKTLNPDACNQFQTVKIKTSCLDEVEKTMNTLKEQNILYAGSLYYEAGNYEEAIKAYTEAIEKKGSSVRESARLNLATAYGIEGLRLHKELEYTNKGLQIIAELKKTNPQNPEIYTVEGYLYEIRPDLRLALRAYDKALEIDANYAPAYAGRCHAKQIQGFDLSGALSDCRKAAEFDSQGKIAGIYLQLCNLEKSDKKAEYCQKVLDSPKVTMAQKSAVKNLLAKEYLNKGELSAALDLSKEALELDSDEPNNYVILAMVYNKQGEYVLAREAAEKAVRLDKMKAVAYGEIGAAFLGMDELERAKEAFRKALVLIPQDPSLLVANKGYFEDQYCSRLRVIAEKEQQPFQEENCQ